MDPAPPRIHGYRFERVLGRGGMGVVWAAHDVNLDRTVAIKVMRPDTPSPELLVERLKREAKAAARIESQHTARVLQLGETVDGGDPFIVMEYVDGRSLRGEIAHGPFAVDRVIDIAQQLCAGLIEAHAHGIVHRDLKPSNIFLCAKNGSIDFVKILDFGAARVLDQPGLTVDGAIVGTYDYMAPEQLAGDELDHRADVYAVGLVVYEMLTGARLFSGGRASSTVERETPFSWALAPRRVSMPSGLAELVVKCLAPDRDQRFASMSDVASALASSRSTPRIDVGPRDAATVKMRASTKPDSTLVDDKRTFDSDSGRIEMTWAAPGVVVIHVIGVADGPLAKFVRDTAEELWAATSSTTPSSSKLKAYFDLTSMTGFRSSFRKAMYNWQAETRGRTEQVVLVRSHIVATIIQQASRFLGGGAAVTADRAHWERVLSLDVRTRTDSQDQQRHSR
jgi:serine/threonine protein kinase